MVFLRILVTSALASLLFLGYLYGWWPCAVVATAVLSILFCQAQSQREAVFAALVGGYIAWRPYQDSLSAYGQVGVNLLVVWQAITLIPVALSLRWGWRRGLRMVWFFPLVWIGGEYLRMLGPIGFPFGALAIPAHEQLWLIQIAEIGGLHMVSAVIAMGSGLLLDAWSAGRAGKRYDWPRLGVSALSVGCVLALVLGYGILRIEQIERSLVPGPQVAVIQPDVPLDYRSNSDYDGDVLLAELKAMSEAAAQSEPRPQLIVWPEGIRSWELLNPEYYEQPFADSLFAGTALPAKDMSREERVRRWDDHREGIRRENAALQAWVDQLGIPLLFGQGLQIPQNVDGQPVFAKYNGARLLRPGGSKPAERQLKVRLFPGGEYVPLDRERLRAWLSSTYLIDWLDSINDLQPGTFRERFPLVEGADSESFHVSICAEILDPESAAVFDHPEEPFFHVSIANEGTFQRRTAQLITYMTLPFRAIEARRGIARSANTGISGFVSPTGAHYARVRNAGGAYWTGLGYPEKEALETFRAITQQPETDLSDPMVRVQLATLTEQISALRAEAGVSGYSVARVDSAPVVTVYQRLGDWFPRLALLGLGATTLAALLPCSRSKLLNQSVTR